MTFNNDCKELKLRAAPGAENDDDFRHLSQHEVSRKNQKSKGLRQTKGPTVKRSLAGNYCYNSPKASFLWSQTTTFLCSCPRKTPIMTEPELERIRLHLESIVGERNSFTQPKHLENTAQHISDQFEAMGLKVTRKRWSLRGLSRKKLINLNLGRKKGILHK